MKDPTGLAVDGTNLVFAAGGKLFESDLDGAHVRQLVAPEAVANVVPIGGGRLLLGTDSIGGSGVYERLPNGKTTLLAGEAGTTGLSPYNHSSVPSTDAAIDPTSFTLAPDGTLYLVDSANILEAARDGRVSSIPAAGAFNGGLVTTSSAGVVYAVIAQTVYRVHGRSLFKLGTFPERLDDEFCAPLSAAPALGGGLYISCTDQVAAPRSAWRSGIVEWTPAGTKPLLISRP